MKQCTVTASGVTYCVSPLLSLGQTVREIMRLAKQYREDIPPKLRGMSLMEFYLHLRDAVPYRRDPDGWETISRPGIILAPDWAGPVDCDDKVCVACAWLDLLGYKYGVEMIGKTRDSRIVNGQELGPVWHIFPIVQLNNGSRERPSMAWTPFDATYPGRSAFGKLLYEPVYRQRVLAE